MGVDIDARMQDGISPHAPYTVSPILLRQLVTLARTRNMPLAMHLAESREELAFLKTGTGPFQELLDERSMWDAEAVPRGSRPLDYLRLLADAPRALVIHGNYLNDEEMAFLAGKRERMSLVYCPRTHAFFQHEPYPLTAAIAAGVRVALGTDSRASNPDLDLLAEMRFVARAYPTIDPHDVLRMGTLLGAEALGREDEVGSLTPGKLANVVAVPLPEDLRGTPNDLLAAILAYGWPVSSVWLRGAEQ
jgi:cytosine/adenosine deaminase-related metal-dependent hydrolase